MSWRQASLYVEAHELACWVESQLDDAAALHPGLARELAAGARSLLCGVSRALALPEEREADLAAADARLVELRVMLRLAAEVGLLSPRRARFVIGRADRIGRMLGGWRRTRRDRRATAAAS